MDLGKGLGRWKTMPTRRRSEVTSCVRMLFSSRRISPSRRAPRTVSCMRLRVRRSGDFVRGNSHADVKERLLVAIEEVDLGNGHAYRKGRGGLARPGIGHGWRNVYGQGGPHRSMHWSRP